MSTYTLYDDEATVNADAEPFGKFYVTVRDAGKVGFLLGPYDDIRDALDNVRRGRALACAANSRAWFYAYGVTRVAIDATPKVVFS